MNLFELPEWLDLLLQALGALVIISTCLVRLTPSKKDDELAGKVMKVFQKVLMFLPTLGINPKTKKLLEAMDEMKKEVKETL